MTRREKAEENFMQGYNCSQSLVLAFADLTDMKEDALLKLSSGFGGGMGRLREVCGAVSGMFIIASILFGYSDPKDKQKKDDLYIKIQKLGLELEKTRGSIVCRELLNLDVKHEPPLSSERTANFYDVRPCMKIIGDAAEILENFLKNNGLIK